MDADHPMCGVLIPCLITQLLTWSQLPGLLPRVPSGPDRGKGWYRVSVEALQGFARDRDIDVRFSAVTELRQRGEDAAAAKAEPPQRSLF